MRQYQKLLKHIIKNGVVKENRTGINTLSIFGYQMRFDLTQGFPLVTTKRVHIKSIIHELLWMLKGDTNVQYLNNNGVTIWDEWATAEQCARWNRKPGDLGPVYGHQWRNFGAQWNPEVNRFERTGADQISAVIQQISKNPNSRRLIVSAWDPVTADIVALPPCHTLFQFNTREIINHIDQENRANVPTHFLDCQLYQRSGDAFLGVPFNIASYALLTSMVAQVCNMIPGEFVHTFGDVHIYENHLSQVDIQIKRQPFSPPKLKLNQSVESIFDFKYEDIGISGYYHHPAIKADVAV